MTSFVQSPGPSLSRPAHFSKKVGGLGGGGGVGRGFSAVAVDLCGAARHIEKTSHSEIREREKERVRERVRAIEREKGLGMREKDLKYTNTSPNTACPPSTWHCSFVTDRFILRLSTSEKRPFVTIIIYI